MKLPCALSQPSHSPFGWKTLRRTSCDPSSASTPTFLRSWAHMWDSKIRLAANAHSSCTSEKGTRHSRPCDPRRFPWPWIQRCHLTALISRIHCSTILCQHISDFSHPRPSAHVVVLLGPMEHVRHAPSNPRRNNALAVGSASELLWQHAIIGLHRTLDLSHIILTYTTRLMRTLRTLLRHPFTSSEPHWVIPVWAAGPTTPYTVFVTKSAPVP